MKDEKIYRISLLVSLLGLVALFVFAHISSPESVDLEELGHGDIGDRVKIEGTVGSVHVSEGGHLFFHVKEGNGKIDVVLFEDDLISMDLEPDELEDGDKAVVIGDIELYRGDIQIQPVEIRLD